MSEYQPYILSEPPGNWRPATRRESATTTPAGSTPARSTPARITPARITPARITPVRSTTARITPVRSTSVRSTSVRTTPAKSRSNGTPIGSGRRTTVCGALPVLKPERTTTVCGVLPVLKPERRTTVCGALPVLKPERTTTVCGALPVLKPERTTTVCGVLPVLKPERRTTVCGALPVLKPERRTWKDLAQAAVVQARAEKKCGYFLVLSITFRFDCVRYVSRIKYNDKQIHNDKQIVTTKYNNVEQGSLRLSKLIAARREPETSTPTSPRPNGNPVVRRATVCGAQPPVRLEKRTWKAVTHKVVVRARTEKKCGYFLVFTVIKCCLVCFKCVRYVSRIRYNDYDTSKQI